MTGKKLLSDSEELIQCQTGLKELQAAIITISQVMESLLARIEVLKRKKHD